MPGQPPVERRLLTSPAWLLHARVYLHAALPLVLVLLAVVVVVDLLGLGGPAGRRYLVGLEYGVLAYFVVELAVDFRLYRDRRAFWRDRWLDLVLVVPIVLAIQFAAWLGGVALAGRAYLTLELVRALELELYAIDELALGGTRLQRWLKLVRRFGRYVTRDPREG